MREAGGQRSKADIHVSLRLMRNADFIEKVGRLVGKGFGISFIGTTTLPSGQLASHDRRLAMALQRGEVQGYNFNRMAVEFTMVNQGKVVPCSISTAAMDDLEGRRDVKSDQRIDQFMRLREIIEERASRKFFEEQAQADRPVVLRSNDFSS